MNHYFVGLLENVDAVVMELIRMCEDSEVEYIERNNEIEFYNIQSIYNDFYWDMFTANRHRLIIESNEWIEDETYEDVLTFDNSRYTVIKFHWN